MALINKILMKSNKTSMRLNKIFKTIKFNIQSFEEENTQNKENIIQIDEK
jgi:hypothetical protein